ncbi:hypothetical protein MKY07_00250 [Solibacillus sp. FSL W7-1472]|uniref:hypothetical protein n=1 Tax=Solibacillus sp. FSL W7-1472 TaxID=2921707 RepID=UPI0030D7AED5
MTFNEERKCRHCGSSEFDEATDYLLLRKSKVSFVGSEKVYTFCISCGEVQSIRLTNPNVFKK